MAGCQPDAQPTSSVVTGLRLNNLLGEPDARGFSRAEQKRDFVFPLDHGPHNRYRSEWWYLTAVLEDENGNEYILVAIFILKNGGQVPPLASVSVVWAMVQRENEVSFLFCAGESPGVGFAQ